MRSTVRAIALVAAALSIAARAEEGGSGHYLPGSMASFIDGAPLAETLLLRLNAVDYNGDISQNVPIPVAGSTVADVDAGVTGFGLTMLWRPSWGGSGKWSYSMTATASYLWVDVDGAVNSTLGTVRRSDSVSGLGDLIVQPMLLNYSVNPDFNINYRISLYAPTGSYQVGRLANAGKNFWTVEPTVGFMYFGQKNGREASVFLAADFNQENPDTDYKSGTQVHVDSTFAQHLPLWSGLAGVGLSAFWYQQVTGDSGAGATFGDFKARTTGVGPVFSYIGKAGGNDLLTEFKWLHEMGVEKRLSGDTLFLKVAMKF